MEKSYILLDVGGTQVKGGIADSLGNIKGEILSIDAHSKENKEVIFNNFAVIIRQLLKRVAGSHVAGIGMAFPGPFDYKKGVSLMKGLDKYESIYGISIEEELKSRVVEIKEANFCFLHDVEAFAIGESYFGEIYNSIKVLCLCIGTGAGSAFIKNKRVIKKEELGVPMNGWLFDTPYKESIIDDYLSVRGLARISHKALGETLSGKELYNLCKQNDSRALKVYQEFGKDLRNSILPFLEKFQPDAVIIGGQISVSFIYFGQEFSTECDKRNINVYLEPETSVKAMQGLFIVMEQEERDVKS